MILSHFKSAVASICRIKVKRLSQATEELFRGRGDGNNGPDGNKLKRTCPQLCFVSTFLSAVHRRVEDEGIEQEEEEYEFEKTRKCRVIKNKRRRRKERRNFHTCEH